MPNKIFSRPFRVSNGDKKLYYSKTPFYVSSRPRCGHRFRYKIYIVREQEREK